MSTSIEKELRNQLELYRAVIRNFPTEAILLFDANLRCKLIKGAELLNVPFTPENLESKTIQETFTTEICQELEPRCRAALVGTESRFELLSQNRFYDIYIHPVKNEQGQILAGMLVSRDINSLKNLETQLEDSEQRYQLIAETSKDAVLIIDENSNIQYANQSTEKIFGCPITDLIGKSLTKLMPTYYRYAHLTGLKNYAGSAKNSGPHTMRYPGLHQNGKEIQLEITYDKLSKKDGKTLFCSVIRDITEKFRAEEILSLLESAIQHTSEAILITDAALEENDGPHILVANPAFTTITGYTAEEIIGKTPRFLQGPKTDLLVMKRLYDNLSRGQMFYGEAVGYRKDGTEIFVEWQITPIRSESGQITHFIAIHRDVTERHLAEQRLRDSEEGYRLLSEHLESRVAERTIALKESNDQLLVEIMERKRAEKELRESNGRIANILESINDGFLAISHEGSLTYFNRRAGQLLQKTHEELLNPEIVEDFLKTDSMASLEQENGRVVIEKFYEPLQSWFEIYVYPYREGLSVYFRDISQRKRAEEEIKKALAKEKELSELKSRFVTLTSHEFRTPLSVILASGELLEHYSHKWNETKKQEILRRIQTSALRMAGLLEDVLLLGKAEAGRLDFKPLPLDLIAYVTGLLEEIQCSSGSQHRLLFTTNGEHTTTCMDEKLLRPILTNLLSNAIKYSPTGSCIRLELSLAPTTATFTIQDEGIGIPAVDQPHLFEVFHRANNVGTIPGTGLGLAIVKHCVELHLGEIEVNSQVGIGTTIRVCLPIEQRSTYHA